jgi:hypothetical protein
MTLRDKFKEVEIKKGITNELEKIADDYAIEILETYHNGLFIIPLKEGEAKKIVEYIKSKKGL